MIQQNTPEWLEMRKNKIGASDAPIIMGVSPWKTPYQLWEEKLDLAPQPDMTHVMRRGHELEPIARQVYNDYTGNCAEPEVVIHPEREWMMASLDGISLDRSIVLEIKCPGKRDHDIAGSGKVPEKYYPQLQHQLACIGANSLHYFSYTDDGFHLVEVERDDKYIASLYTKEGEFYKMMQNFEAPPLADADFEERDDAEWLSIANELREIQALKKKESELKKRLIFLSQNRSCKGGGLKFRKSVGKGSVDYNAIPALEGLDLEKYRRPPVERWRLS